MTAAPATPQLRACLAVAWLGLGLGLAGCQRPTVGTAPPDDPPVDSGEDTGGGVETIPSASGPWLRGEVATPGPVTFTEILAHPRDDGGSEWIELHNPMVFDMDLSGWSLAGGVDFAFPEGTILAAGGFLVVAADPSLLGVEALGPWEGRLDNGGERIELVSNGGRLIDSVAYGDDEPWPVQADGSGHSLAKLDHDAASDRAEHWAVSLEPGGSPGESNLLDPLLPPTTRELVAADATWRYDASGDEPAADWAEPAYDDSGWELGDALFYAGETPQDAEATLWFTADNYAAAYLGDADGGGLTLVGEDSDGSWTTVEEVPLTLTPQDHLFMAVWELTGDSTTQMVIAEVELEDAVVGTDLDSVEWVLGPSDANPGALPANPPPSEGELVALIQDADAAGSWAAPGIETGRSSSPWGSSVGSWFSDAAGFVWADSFDGDSISNVWNTYALFRSVEPLIAPAGTVELEDIPTTTLFRTAFAFDDDPAATTIELTCTVDDGMVVWLNGVELLRENMPEGEVDGGTLAIASVDEATELWAEVSAEALVRGENLLAVEVHQAALDDPDLSFGCALTAETWPASVEPTLLLNEVPAAGDEPLWVELINVGAASEPIEGLALVSSAGDTQLLAGSSLAPGSLALVELGGLSVLDGELLYLYDDDGETLLDAVRLQLDPRARAADGGPWRVPTEATPGEANAIELVDDIVIHEIMYHRAPLSQQGEPVTRRDEEWIELYNRGEAPVDLSGWQLVDAVSFSFPDGTTLEPGGFLVLSGDAEALLDEHPDIAVVGDWEGRLDNRGERLLLLDAAGNPADELRYHDGGRWPSAADGGGSSLELRDPWADNAAPEAWTASDESARTAWVEISYRGVAEDSVVGPDGVWEELVLGMLDAGELLIDDISVLRDPDGAAVELVQDGGFDGGGDSWRLLGNHRHSELVPDPDDASNTVLRLVATGPTGHMHNHAETTLWEPITAVEHAISFRARWVSGSNQLHSRLYFQRLPRTTLVDQPALSGTPGAPNSAAVDNSGPTFGELSQDVAVPAPGEPLIVSIPVDDPDGVGEVTLWASVDGGAFEGHAMGEGEPGSWWVQLDGQHDGAIVQLYVEASDNLGASATWPAAGPDSRVLYTVAEPADPGGLHALRILMTHADADWLHQDVNLMSNDPVGATVVYQERELFYDVGVRVKGSQRGRPTDLRLGYGLRFRDDRPFRGSHTSVMIDRSEGVGFGQREVLLNLVMARAGAVSAEHNDIVHIVAPRSTYDGAAELQLDRFTNLVLASQFADGDQGTRFEYELVYYPTTTDDGTAEGLKLPQPDVVTGTSLTDLGDDPEAYRWVFLIKNNEREDDYEALMQLCWAMGLSSAELLDVAEDVIDVEQWLRAFALATLSGATDQYGGAGSLHNAQFYLRPEDGRMLYFPHDLDYFSSYAMAVVGNSDLGQLIEDADHERSYYGHLQDIIEHAYSTAYLDPWCDQLGALLPDQDFDGHCDFIDDRARWVLQDSSDAVMQRYPWVEFAITTGGGGELEVASDEIALEGRGWVDLRGLSMDGEALPMAWIDASTWRTSVPLELGRNELVIVGADLRGEAVGSDTVVVTRTDG